MMSSIPKIIYPLGAYTLHGLIWQKDPSGKPYAMAVDSFQGHLLKIDPYTEGATVLNRLTAEQFRDVTDIALAGDILWAVRDNRILYCHTKDYELETFMELPERIEGITVSEGGVYVSSSDNQSIFVIGRATRTLLRVMAAPGIGCESLTLKGEELWVSDATEETVYCIEAKTGVIKYRALTAFPHPTSLGFCDDQLYVLYTGMEHYIRENPNDPDPFAVDIRDKTFIHQLDITTKLDAPIPHTLSNGFLVEMTYLEELDSEDPKAVENLNWRIALPTNTDRQKLISVDYVGLPFTEETIEEQRIAKFALGNLQAGEACLFGWKALVELHGIKYELKPEMVDDIPELPEDIKAQYTIDDDDLCMDSPIMQAAAKAAVGDETNLLLKMLRIREYVYDQLSYRLTPYIATPDEVWQRGTASCGEYVGVLLGLARINGIACRTIGRYKCPPYAEQHQQILHQYYNHVWIEFYVPGFGWLPMESNPDDIGRAPYPTRWFMGLPWFHVEIGKGISFETIKPQPYSIGELAVNHVRFKIIKEL
ncbi:MAG: transglutaminase-like domain-containing protein [Pseudanabaena sp. ELA607]